MADFLLGLSPKDPMGGNREVAANIVSACPKLSRFTDNLEPFIPTQFGTLELGLSIIRCSAYQKSYKPA